jgi:hypothetical protein
MHVVPCFLDETGSLRHPGQPILAVGLLAVHDVPTLTNALYTASFNFNARIRQQRLALQRDIREVHASNATLQEFQMLLAKTRHHEYKFTGVNAANLQDYISLLNLFFACNSSEFHAIVVERSDAALARFGKEPWPAYVGVTKLLLQRRLRQPSFVCCDWQTRPKDHRLCLEDECCKLPNVTGCISITSETSPFLQVVDLLIGVVSFDWRDARKQIAPSASSQLKRQLVVFVKDKLGMAPTARFLRPGGHFFRRSAPIRFTVWQPRLGAEQKNRAQGMQRGQFTQGE